MSSLAVVLVDLLSAHCVSIKMQKVATSKPLWITESDTMGRIKKTPRQSLQNVDDCTHEKLLGRCAVFVDNQESHPDCAEQHTKTNNNKFLTAMLLAEEICVPDAQDIQDELRDSDDDDDENKRRRSKPKRLQSRKKKRKTKGSNKTYRRKTAARDKNLKTKQVQFAETGHLACVIPPPQVQILLVPPQEEGSLSRKLQLTYHGRPRPHPGNEMVLKRFPLSQQVHVIVHDGDDTSSSSHTCSSKQYAVTTPQGVRDVLKFFVVLRDEHLGTPLKSNHLEDDSGLFLQSMINAITQHDTMAMDLVYSCSSHQHNSTGRHSDHDNNNNCQWYIQIRILPSAFATSQQTHSGRSLAPFPRKQNQLQRQRSSPAQTLQYAMAWLFPGSLLEDTVTSPRSGSVPVVTAKQVYALTDNVQLLSRRLSPAKPLRKIPGLLPTLRPYQESAVRWMLEREGESTAASPVGCPNDEWKLAWVVLTADVGDGGGAAAVAASCFSSNIKNEASSLQNPVSLIHWRVPKDDNISSQNILFICPFTGWLARSVADARALTLGIETATDKMTRKNKGGILAESMGLGKTVEVLACILAHPRPCTKPRIKPTTRARRMLDFTFMTDDRDMEAEIVPSVNEDGATSTVGFVQDRISDFGDADMDDNDGDGSDSDVRHDNDGDDSDSDVRRTTAPPPTTPIKSSTKTAFPVTPDEELDSVQERWLDDDVIGSCVCSRLILFSTRKQDKPILLCSSCDEPMHYDCAVFSSEEARFQETNPVRLRQRFSNRTVECLLCDSDRCPCCAASYQNPIESSATLIITPSAILHQWIREIRRHTAGREGEPLNVVVYEGMNRLAKSSGKKMESFKYMHPGHLADADIVLMTFDALKSDLGHSDDNKYIATSSDTGNKGSLRERKRYRVVPSPLLSVLWWRVALDEAQRIETPTAASAKMALKLHADIRWCVSGTPVGRGKLDDLYGLLSFLRLEPFADKRWFSKCLNPAYQNVSERIGHLLRNVFWRSTKTLETVREQMGVPEQIEKKVVLKFSSIEKHFYDRQLERTLSTASELTERSRSGRKRKTSQLSTLAEHIHQLRAACCHPQVGSNGVGPFRKRKIWTNKHVDASGSTGLGSRVMTMGQILDRFIDEAKQKCEEAQRLTILHSNGMAATSKLKVEAKDRNVDILESDVSLLRQSCKLYKESLLIGEENAKPTMSMGEAAVSGSVGFLSSQHKVTDGKCVCNWKFPSHPEKTGIWSTITFESTGRKLTQIRVRPVFNVPTEISGDTSERFHWSVLIPKEIALQVSSGVVDDEFFDVAHLEMPDPSSLDSAWVQAGDFRTNKSKNWRIRINSFHQENTTVQKHAKGYCSVGYYAGLEVELYEAEIAYDPLQRLHCLHNASLSFRSLIDQPVNDEDTLSSDEKTSLIEACKSMDIEAEKIESLYMGAARAAHNECHRRLDEALRVREDLEENLFKLTCTDNSRNTPKDAWDDMWWDDFLVLVLLQGNENHQRQLCERLYQDFDGFLSGRVTETSNQNDIIPFPDFGDVIGLRTALNMRICAVRDGLGRRTTRNSKAAFRALAVSYSTGDDTTLGSSRAPSFRCPAAGHAKTIKAIHALSANPTSSEKFENRHCQLCKADWHQTGPKCRHCKIGEDLEDLQPDRVTVLLLSAIHSLLKGPFGNAIIKKTSVGAPHLVDRAKGFFDVLQAEKRERASAWRMWRAHLDLLNDIDELNQCKTAMRLSFENEDLTQIPEEQLSVVVVPMDVPMRYHDHAAKQAMALGDLRRAKDTLRYLKNQSCEITAQISGEARTDDEGDRCVVCLSSFGECERAVLRCGHFFHMTPCLKGLRSAGYGGCTWINCPMRCRIRTESQSVMIATHRRVDDGSRSRRDVKGSWGTKVTRLVADVMDIRDLGEKGVLFSQWDDMLDIVQLALVENKIRFVRATSLRQIGGCIERFSCEKDCIILLLNVKNGAEGLTLLEAQHVFMVEPLLTCGLDSQAINRVHRIGQNKKTFVHRYLIEGTVEMKIDRLREEHQTEDQQIEDAITESKKSAIHAGGIDGGFQSQEELMEVLRP